ncbi:MAG TPA: LptE family protein [Thermoanaerobaculia bacterium]|nr:LptE family protein [Thermoanaerobaculia bacterium]HUM30782.1 LptE family protein [Thermoanaerobaculia bacterium]HXK69018.1 LptE family protein [Thermoanaerobaculia bacterium]
MRTISFSILTLLLAACGYHLVGQSSTLPKEIHSIYIPTFENKTGQPELELRLTAAVADEFVARGRYRVAAAPEDADAILQGVITSFGLSPMALDPDGRATDYQLTIQLKVSLHQVGKDEPVWENPSFTFREQYSVGTVAEDYYDRLFQAVDELSQSFAQSLITSMLEGF